MNFREADILTPEEKKKYIPAKVRELWSSILGDDDIGIQTGKAVEREFLETINYGAYATDMLSSYFHRVALRQMGPDYREFLNRLREKAISSGPEMFMGKPQPSFYEEKMTELMDQALAEVAKEFRYPPKDEEKMYQDIKNCQKRPNREEEYNPSEPATAFADDLFSTLAEKLNLEDWSDLRYYSAVGSRLDYSGVDAFFELEAEDENGERRLYRVPFDLTIKSEAEKMDDIAKKRARRGVYLSEVILSTEGKEEYKRGRDGKMLDLFARQLKQAFCKKNKKFC